eukprot:gene3941-14018_t
MGLPEDIISFIFNGQNLSDSVTNCALVADLAFEDGDIVDAVPRRFDIGHFGPHLSSPGAALLSSSSAALGGSREEVVVCGGADFKVELSRSELESVVGVESVARLVSLFGGRVDQIKLRRVSVGSHGAGHGGEQGGGLDACCIPFHLDEAELTMQVALNSPDDYTGGDLVFLLPDAASALVPSRCPGSATVHNNSVVHGVTRMQAGVRYSLFLMQLLDMQVGGEGAAAAS